MLRNPQKYVMRIATPIRMTYIWTKNMKKPPCVSKTCIHTNNRKRTNKNTNLHTHVHTRAHAHNDTTTSCSFVSFLVLICFVGLRACAGDRYQKFRCGAPGARCPGGSHRRPSAVACSPPREGSAWSTPNASQVSLKRMKASQTFDKLRIGRKKRACTTFFAFCQKLYASYMLLHFLKTKTISKKC